MTQHQATEGDRKPRPDYPPKTPPPPKSPPSPFPPDFKGGGRIAADHRRRGLSMINRPGVNWRLQSQMWVAKGAASRAVKQLRDWGYTPDDDKTTAVVRQLVHAAVADGGTRISLHMTHQHDQAAIVAVSHHPAVTEDPAFLRRIVGLGVADCGTESTPDGRYIWAVIEVEALALPNKPAATISR